MEVVGYSPPLVGWQGEEREVVVTHMFTPRKTMNYQRDVVLKSKNLLVRGNSANQG